MKAAAIILVAVLCAITVVAQDVTSPATLPAQNQPQDQLQQPNAKTAAPADLPDEYGIYIQTTQGWQRLRLTQQMSMNRSGETFHMKVTYAGPHAALQLPAGRPTFHARASDVSKAEALMIFAFKVKKDRRTLETIDVRDLSAERMRTVLLRCSPPPVQMVVKRVAAEVYAITPEGDIPAGEYILTPDGNSGYDFSVQ